MTKSTTGGQQSTDEVTDAMTLDEAVRIVRAAIDDSKKRLRQYVDSTKNDPISLGGETETGYEAEVVLDPARVAQIMLDYDCPIYNVLGEDAPEEMWDELAQLAGLKYVSTIRSILSNEKYKGEALLQKTYTVDYLSKEVRKNTGEVPFIRVRNSHEPIIDPDVFDHVQDLLRQRTKYRSKVYTDHPFAGKIICGDCGATYGHKVWRVRSTGEHYDVWYCNHKYDGDVPCATPYFREEEIKAAFEQMLEMRGEADVKLHRQLIAAADTNPFDDVPTNRFLCGDIASVEDFGPSGDPLKLCLHLRNSAALVFQFYCEPRDPVASFKHTLAGFLQHLVEHLHGQRALSLNRFQHFRFEGFIIHICFGVFGLGALQVPLQERHLLPTGAADDHIAGGAFHPVENLMQNTDDDIVQDVHGVSRLPVAFRAVAGLVVADVADALLFDRSPVRLTVDLPIRGQGQPAAAVSAEDIAGKQGLAGGVQRDRPVLLVLIGALRHLSLGHIEEVRLDDLQLLERLGVGFAAA